MTSAMDMARPPRNRASERILDRRAARARRSRWLGRLLFSLTGMALLVVLRMNPEVVGEVIAWSQGATAGKTAPVLSRPTDIRVRAMPGDTVPVRRGGSRQESRTRPDAPPSPPARLTSGG